MKCYDIVYKHEYFSIKKSTIYTLSIKSVLKFDKIEVRGYNYYRKFYLRIFDEKEKTKNNTTPKNPSSSKETFS